MKFFTFINPFKFPSIEQPLHNRSFHSLSLILLLGYTCIASPPSILRSRRDQDYLYLRPANLIPGCNETLIQPTANVYSVIYAKMKTLRFVCIRLTGLTVAFVLMIRGGREGGRGKSIDVKRGDERRVNLEIVDGR